MIDQDLLKRRGAVLGANAPIFYEEPVHIVRGERAWLYDAEGRRYLDAYNNVPVVGHCHPRVVEALTKQASMLNVHTRYLHETVVNYGERLLKTFESDVDYRVSFVCTGSEANELALRMVRAFTGKEGIVCTDLTYHGNTAAVYELAKTLGVDEVRPERVRAVPYPQKFRPLAGVAEEDLGAAYVALVEQAIAELQASDAGFAGLLMCPILANEGLPNVPDGFWEGVEKAVRAAGGLIIFDEVQSGFGRTGEMWAHKQTGIVPDVVTMGKPMGNGHPLAAAVVRADVFDHFQKDVRYFNTFGGNAVSCAVGMAVLDVLEDEKLFENAAVTGATWPKNYGACKHDSL